MNFINTTSLITVCEAPACHCGNYHHTCFYCGTKCNRVYCNACLSIREVNSHQIFIQWARNIVKLEDERIKQTEAEEEAKKAEETEE